LSQDETIAIYSKYNHQNDDAWQRLSVGQAMVES